MKREADRRLVRHIEADARADGWSDRGVLAFAVLASSPDPKNEARARKILADERAREENA